MADKTFTKPLPSTSFERVIPPPTTSTAQLTPSAVHPPSTNNIKRIEPTIFSHGYSMELTSTPGAKPILMSPPEMVPHESFVRSPATSANHVRPIFPKDRFPMSPPISPDCKPGHPSDSHHTRTINDPILFPSTEHHAAQLPLFDAKDRLNTRKVVEGHVAARASDMFLAASPPRRSEYQLALEFKSQVARRFNADRRLWLRRELAYLMEDKALQSGGRKYTNIAPATGRPHRANNTKSAKAGGVVKTKSQPRVPKQQVVREGTPDTKRVAREDRDFDALVDYSPPTSSLPNKPNSLKVDWKGSPVSLADDIHIYLLHPDEVSLAANLRLDCATYLTSKRRIFVRRLECYRIGKEFRKTDAQQACKIDVNKASKLWQAFEKVGWLDERWVKNHA